MIFPTAPAREVNGDTRVLMAPQSLNTNSEPAIRDWTPPSKASISAGGWSTFLELEQQRRETSRVP